MPHCLQIWGHTETSQDEVSPGRNSPGLLLLMGYRLRTIHSSPRGSGNKVSSTKTGPAARSMVCPYLPRTWRPSVKATWLSQRRLKNQSFSNVGHYVQDLRVVGAFSRPRLGHVPAGEGNGHTAHLAGRGATRPPSASHEVCRLEGSFRLIFGERRR